MYCNFNYRTVKIFEENFLDASVIMKWFKEEEGSDLALEIREGFHKGVHEIIVPDLLLYEISNALRFDKKFTSELITGAINSLFEMDIIITVPSGDLISDAVKIAIDNDVTVYDAIYIALSISINGTFITADKRLYEKIKEFRNCKLLSDYIGG